MKYRVPAGSGEIDKVFSKFQDMLRSQNVKKSLRFMYHKKVRFQEKKV